MAAGDLLITRGTQLLFADHSGDFGAVPATAANSLIRGTPTDVQIDLTGVAASGGARQAVKTATLGDPQPPSYSVLACIEHETAPAAGGVVDFYWAPSPSAIAGTGNPGSTTGVDAAYTPTDDELSQMQYIGSLPLKNNVINIGYVGTFTPKELYGNLVVVNKGSTGLRSTATAMDETHVVMNPLIPQIQS